MSVQRMSLQRINKVREWMYNNIEYNLNVIEQEKHSSIDRINKVRTWMIHNIHHNLIAIQSAKYKIQRSQKKRNTIYKMQKEKKPLPCIKSSCCNEKRVRSGIQQKENKPLPCIKSLCCKEKRVNPGIEEQEIGDEILIDVPYTFKH